MPFIQQLLFTLGLCHILAIFVVFQTFSLSYLMVIHHCDLLCYCCDGLGTPWTVPIRNWCVCSDCCTHWPLSCLPPLAWDTESRKWSQLITLRWPPHVQVEGRVTSNPKLERIKFSEEGTSTAKPGQKWGLSLQTARLWTQRKSSWV